MAQKVLSAPIIYGPNGQPLLNGTSLQNVQIRDAAGNLILDTSQTNPGLNVGGVLTPQGGIAGALGTTNPGNALGFSPVNPNKLFNSSARFGWAGWNTSNWTASGGVQAQPGANWSQNAIAGSWAVGGAGSVAANSTSGYVESAEISSGPGLPWTVSFTGYAGGLTGTGTLQVELHAYNGTTDLGGFAWAIIPAGAGWQRVSATGTTPANTTTITVRVFINGGSSGTSWSSGNAAVWSMIKVENGTLATTYTFEGDLWPYNYSGVLIPGLTAQYLGSTAIEGILSATNPQLHFTNTYNNVTTDIYRFTNRLAIVYPDYVTYETNIGAALVSIDNSGRMAITQYPSGTGNTGLAIGSNATGNTYWYGLGIYAPAYPPAWPFGVVIGGNKVFEIQANGAAVAYNGLSANGQMEVEVATLYAPGSAQLTTTSGTPVLFANTQVSIGHIMPTASYYLEVLLQAQVSGTTAYANLLDVTANTVVTNSQVSTGGYTVVRSGALSLTAGHTYALQLWNSTAGDTTICYIARIVAVF